MLIWDVFWLAASVIWVVREDVDPVAVPCRRPKGVKDVARVNNYAIQVGRELSLVPPFPVDRIDVRRAAVIEKLVS